MITLYAKTNCGYTTRVVAALDAHGLSYIKKNIADPTIRTELIEKGGKAQVPYLIDGDVAMYESEDIVAHIENTYGKEECNDGVCVHFDMAHMVSS